MSVSAQETVFHYVGNGVTVTFAFNCQVLLASDLNVYVDDALVSSGFGVSGIGSLTGGSVTFDSAPANQAAVRLERVVTLERTTDYQQNGDFLSRVVNPDFNRIWMALQQHLSTLNRALKVPKSDAVAPPDLPTAATRANNLLGFDASGNPVAVAPVAQSATALQALLALFSGSSLSGFIQSGDDAGPRTVQDELRETVKLTQFVLAGDVGAHQALQRAHDALPALGGTIELPAEWFTMTAGIVVTKNLLLRGAGQKMTILQCFGNNGGQPFIKQTAGDTLAFENMTFAGNGSTAGPIADAGSIGYQAINNSYSQNALFLYWETVSVWVGGYYHKHINSYFEYCKVFFDGYDQNNISFFGCRWSNFETGMLVASGEGPISFIGGSIESWGDKAFTSVLGKQIALSAIGVFIENAPLADCPIGITTPSGKYDQGVLVYSNGAEIYPVSILGCVIFTPGIFRLCYFDNAVGCHLISKGNTFVARGVATAPPNAIYSLSGANISCDLHDGIVGALVAPTVYVDGLPVDLKGCTVFDPVTRDYLRPVQSWTAAAMQNAWTNGGNTGWTLDRTGRVQLRGAVSGDVATATTMFTLPVALRPAVGKFFVCSYAGGFIGVRINNVGAVFLDGAVGVSMTNINLDGISFYIGS